MADIIILGTQGPSEAASPDPARLISGEYKTRTYSQYEGEEGRLYAGIWESTPGKMRISYDEWEFCHIISGVVVLTNDVGQGWRLKAGDAFIIPPGFTGTWETVEAVRKHYVILTPRV
jgi:uncharacterized cupin superfamily protein